MQKRFKELLFGTKRPGMESLLIWLENKTDFFKAPASTQYHDSQAGGLLKHSLDVHERMTSMATLYIHDVPAETFPIVALLHDICKANFYKEDTRNVKENGAWKTVPFYSVEDKIPLGHGEKSVILIQHHLRLTLPEIMAIRWHMSSFGNMDYSTQMALNKALDAYPIITLLHSADLASAFLNQWRQL